MTLISFYCFIALASTSNITLIRLSDNGHPCLTPNFKGNVSLLRIMFILGLTRGISKIASEANFLPLLVAQHM